MAALIAVREALAALPAQQVINSEADALTLAVHATLELDGLRCISSSEETAKASGELPASSGPLPPDWNDSGDVYCLYYKHAASPLALFTVKIIVMDDVLLVHAASDQATDVYCLELRTGDFVQFVPSKAKAADLDCEKIYSDLDSLQRAVRVNVTYKLLPFLSSNSKGNSPKQAQSCHLQADANRQGGEPFRGDPGLSAGIMSGPAGLAQMYTDVGRADLAPGGLGGLGIGAGGFGIGGEFGGNMLGPRHPAFGGGGFGGMGGMGGMAAPPGARIDPFGPPGVGGMGSGWGPQGFPGMGRQRPREFPDNDLFRPPGGGDDMFM